jgi:hypothetical protein
MTKQLWEILVPTEKPPCFIGTNRYFTLRYHKLWDQKVIKITGGLTILAPGKGSWVSPNGHFFKERMIPVRIACTKEQIENVMDITAEHYGQIAVMAYKVSDEVLLRHYNG